MSQLAPTILQYQKFIDSISNANFNSVYLIHGEEGFFISKAEKILNQSLLDPSERDFNFKSFDGSNAKIIDVIAECKQFPSFSDRRVVFVKNAESFLKPSDPHADKILIPYLKNPVKSTTLVFIINGKNLDSRSKIYKEIGKYTVFQAVALKSYEMEGFVHYWLNTNNQKLDSTCIAILLDLLGANIPAIDNELNKLFMANPNIPITIDIIKANVAHQNKYSISDIADAFMARNTIKAITIMKHLGKNESKSELIPVIAVLYSNFSAILKVQYLLSTGATRDKIIEETKLRPYFLDKYINAAQKYSVTQLKFILQYLLHSDKSCKGMNASKNTDNVLWEELAGKILQN